MTPEGRLEGRLNRVEAPPAEPDEPIELAERPKPKAYEEQQPYRAPHVSGRRSLALKIVIAAAVLGVALLVAALVGPHARTPGKGGLEMVRDNTVVDSLLSGGTKAPLIVSSEPPGATITIGGAVVGKTPWAGDNTWDGNALVVIELPGYKKWTGKLRGGEQTISANLQR